LCGNRDAQFATVRALCIMMLTIHLENDLNIRGGETNECLFNQRALTLVQVLTNEGVGYAYNKLVVLMTLPYSFRKPGSVVRLADLDLQFTQGSFPDFLC